MADGFGDIDPKRLRELRQEFQQLGADLTTIQKEYSTLLKNDTEAKELLLKYGKEEVNIVKDLSLVTKEQLKDRKITEKLIKKVNKLTQQSIDAEIKIQTTRAKINALIDQGASLTDDEVVEYQKLLVTQIQRNSKLQEAVKYADELVGAAKELDKKSSFFDSLANITKSIPGISGATKAFEEAAEAYREQLGDEGTGLGSTLAAAAAGFKKLGKLALRAFGILTVIEAIQFLNEMDKRVVSIQRNFNLSAENAARFNAEIANSARSTNSLLYNSERLLASLTSVNIALGTAGNVNSDILKTFVLQTERLGISAESASQLAQIYLALGVNSEDFNKELVSQVQSMNASNTLAIDYKDVMEDVKNINKATLLSMNQQSKSIARSVYQAKQLGMTMSQVEGVADSLLNFESSIEAEMKAELLLGKQLNLEKARQFALMDDMGGVAAELAKQEITAAKFGDLNRIQKQALAETFGMSRTEMGEMLVQQEALNKVQQIQGQRQEDILSIQERAATVAEKTTEIGKKAKDLAFTQSGLNLPYQALKSAMDALTGDFSNASKVMDEFNKFKDQTEDGTIKKVKPSLNNPMGISDPNQKVIGPDLSHLVPGSRAMLEPFAKQINEGLKTSFREWFGGDSSQTKVLEQIRDKNTNVYIDSKKVTGVLLNNDTSLGGNS